MHKGFKCLDVAKGWIYISRDIVFEETIFPFSKFNPNAGARLRSEILLLPTYSQPSTVPGYGVEFSGDLCASVQLNPVSTNVSGACEFAAEISGAGADMGRGDVANTTSGAPTPAVASNAASVSGSGSSAPRVVSDTVVETDQVANFHAYNDSEEDLRHFWFRGEFARSRFPYARAEELPHATIAHLHCLFLCVSHQVLVLLLLSYYQQDLVLASSTVYTNRRCTLMALCAMLGNTWSP
jgi:hypothetical protein